MFTVNFIEKTKIKKKEDGNGPFFKKNLTDHKFDDIFTLAYLLDQLFALLIFYLKASLYEKTI